MIPHSINHRRRGQRGTAFAHDSVNFLRNRLYRKNLLPPRFEATNDNLDFETMARVEGQRLSDGDDYGVRRLADDQERGQELESTRDLRISSSKWGSYQV